MKIIFLDIDGVMNSQKHGLEVDALYKAGKISHEERLNWDLPYEDTLLVLQRIVKTTKAQLVLSSSWRLLRGRYEQLNTIFKPYGFQLIDKTCDCVSKENLEKCGFKIENTYDYELAKEYEPGRENSLTKTHDRGAEIAWWLYNHKDVESFVILDDDSADIDQYFKDKHVCTSFETGITDDDADKAIKILMGE